MKFKSEYRSSGRRGAILVVVLGALMFFSVLVATYLVFSNESRDASFAISQRNTRAPDVDWMMNEALMMIIRGTGDPNNPFYGEDLLSDYYGHDGINLQIKSLTTDAVALGAHPLLVEDGFIRFPVATEGTNGIFRAAGIETIDDVYSGMLVTFLEGPLENRTYRVIRSVYRPQISPSIPGNPTAPEYDDLFIELESGILDAGTASQGVEVRSLFYEDPTDLTNGGFAIRLNGVPRNSRGIGFDGTNVDQTTLMPNLNGTTPRVQQPRDPSLPISANNFPEMDLDLPVSLQPNHLGRFVDKSALAGDFDEDYDAPDHNNWFLGYRRPDGSVIPSFHRPAVINYILNQADWSSASSADYNHVMRNLARGTFRPLPIREGELFIGAAGPPAIPASAAVNPKFTGGSNSFALRTALRVNQNPAYLNQLARALIEGPWDVDNDKDGVADSIWTDPGLPVFTSPEGKLLRALVAPQIEDLGARLNLNAHGNPQLSASVAGKNNDSAFWAGKVDALNAGTNTRRVFRGIGWGPSEIMLPATSTSGAITNATIRNNLAGLLNDRYRFGEQLLSAIDYPGANNRDFLDALRFGYRPEQHVFNGGFGYSTDPFGRGGLGVGRSGHILSADSGRLIQVDDPMTGVVEPSVNEAINNPYEIDPTGTLNGDRAFTLADLESILKSNEFDSELLPSQLRERLQLLVSNFPEFGRSLTTRSTSDDRPSPIISRQTPAGATAWRGGTNYAIGAIVGVENGRFLRCVRQGVSGTLAPTRAGEDNTVEWEELFPVTPHTSIVQLLELLGVPADSTRGLLAPELRLGRKLDVNRPFGNLVDDNGNFVIDEPLETARRDTNGVDDDGDGVIDELGEVGETRPFRTRNPAEDTTIANQGFGPQWDGPNYTLDDPRSTVWITGAQYDPDSDSVPNIVPTSVPVSGRQLLARHLYILAMALSRDLDNPTQEAALPSVSMTPPATFNPALYKARRLAQWAVNVVDYRDPDSVMTRFVFDPDPFATDTTPTALDHPFEVAAGQPEFPIFPANHNGWSPPMDIYNPADPSTTKIAPARFVVWGVEEPQLLFSESLAYHDVRLRDSLEDPSNEDKSGNSPDEDSDQVRKPEGSLFLELYCPHSTLSVVDQATKPGTPNDLYTGTAALDLARVTPLGGPVWRIALSETHFAGTGREDLAPEVQRAALPDSASFEVEAPDEIAFDPNADTLEYDRFIWFRNVGDVANDPDTAFSVIENTIANNNLLGSDSTATEAAARVFVAPFVPNGNLVLSPGQFLVLAPRTDTRLGSREFSGAYPGLPSDQRFEAAADGVIQFDASSVRLTPALSGGGAPYAPAFPLVIGAPRPSGWMPPTAANPNFLQNVVGLNVSEPMPRGGNYYPQPNYRLNGTQDVDNDGNEDYLLTDAYNDFDDPAVKSAIDEPLDVTRTDVRLPVVPSGTGGLEPELGTIPQYCTAYLQRLADPTLPHDPITNPYRTVDWIPIDLTVFSGEDDEDSINGPGIGYARRSRQRTGVVNPIGSPAVQTNSLYSYDTAFDAGVSANLETMDPMIEEYFIFDTVSGTNPTRNVQSSLSFLNTETVNINPGFQGFDPSLGSLPGPNAVVGNDLNLPIRPYAVHPWLNRPFASHLELMLVPACSQARLFEEFSFNPAAEPGVFPNAGNVADPALINAPFRHLLNFFHSDTGSGTSMELAKLFDFIHTLPRYRGEVDLINPTRLAVPTPAVTPTGEQRQLALMKSLVAPPFAIQYDNQRQGTINLNTVSEFPVWAGLMQGHLNPDEFTSLTGTGSANQLSYENFLVNRRGYTTSAGAISPVVNASGGTGLAGPYNYDPGNLSPLLPTEFGGVFRSGVATPKAIQTPTTPDALRRKAVNGTLLRGGGTLGTNAAAPPAHPALLVRSQTQEPVAPTIAGPLAAIPSSLTLHQDRLRNSFMRYQTLMRMPNLVSDNSQIFLVRLTIGFFEVDAETLSLEDEYNADIGRNQRYQATFVIDRSIPVGFIPGEDLNARDVVIYESYGQ